MRTFFWKVLSMKNTILLCTVGGAHQPILKAIESVSPQYICFFCTDRDPMTRRPGSVRQVTGAGNVIKAKPDDPSSTLPNIPSQAGLNNNQFRCEIVPADDLDGAYFAMCNAIERLAKQFPDASFIADYTGGTKTMTAALVSAVLERNEVELQLVAGPRPDLSRVQGDTAQAVQASIAGLRLQRAMARHLAAWRRFAYREAAEGLASIRVAANNPGLPQLKVLQALSQAFACWDDFDHQGAFNLIGPFAARTSETYPWMLATLKLLRHRTDPKGESARLYDLWRSAERRAAQGRFDDAVARWYRLMEWTAQWQLLTKLGIETADFPADSLPPDMDAVPGRDGKIKIGLWQAWLAAQHLIKGGPIPEFVGDHESRIRDLLNVRNNSILAHGFRPVSAEDWQHIRLWTEDHFLPLLRTLSQAAGLRKELPQLPSEPPQLG